MDFRRLYTQFDPAITAVDCGLKCAPYNDYGVPFCCDTSHAVPSAYQEEWDFLKANSKLWHLWESVDSGETARLQSETPVGQVLIACLGYKLCQRNYRSITCRAFPFFPYFTREGDFIGLTYYWQYEDRCWVISHLDQVTREYVQGFIFTYDDIFRWYGQEIENFKYHSTVMRRVFGRWKRAITLLHRNGKFYKISPGSGRMRKINASDLSKFGPYALAAQMPFPDEDGL